MLRTPGANSLTPGRFAGASYSGSTHPGKRPGNVTFQFPDSTGRSFRQGMGNASLSTWGSDFSPTMHTTNGISPQSPLQVRGFYYHFCRWEHNQNQRSYSQKIILRQYQWIERLATVNGSDRSQNRRWFHRRFGWWPRLFCHTHRQWMSMRTDAKAELNSGASNRALIAQLVEHRVVMREVVSSSPAGPTLRVLK